MNQHNWKNTHSTHRLFKNVQRKCKNVKRFENQVIIAYPVFA